MRKAVIASFALAAAVALAVAATATGAGTAERRHPGLREGLAQPARGGHAHRRRRQPGLPAVVRRRGEEAVEGVEPVQRQGLRVRRRVRDRVAARLHEGAGRVDGRAVQQLVQAGEEVVRLLRDAGVVLARAGQGGRLLARLLLRQPVGRGAQGHADREGEVDRGAEGVQARRPGRDDELHVHHPSHPAELEPECLRHERRGHPGAQERPDRRHRRRPADGVLRHRRAARRRRDRRQAADEGHEGALRSRVPEGQHAPQVRRPCDRQPVGERDDQEDSRTPGSRRPARPI